MKRKEKTEEAVIRRDDEGVHVQGQRFTLGAIARGSGVSRPHVTRIFNGKREPSLKVAQRITGYLGVTIEQFLGFLSRLKKKR